ncbi:MAG TPA: MASE1 domain-containing protein [Candidatus Hydrogenedentes bacterium]|nr:MASE1 domain-containing protein [Candidatus Hydrogenedentota bacterium]HPG67232.1 MASE1 domain-containing protein [Candidatus Hydrogenedentota bacterium]
MICREAKTSVVQRAVLCAVSGALYLAAGLASRAFALDAGVTAPVWLASGVGLALIILVGPGVWPGLLGGAFGAGLSLAAAFNARPLVSIGAAAAIAVGSVLEALAGAALLKRLSAGRDPLASIGGTIRFVGAAMVACVLGSAAGATGACVGGWLPWRAFGAGEFAFWLANVTGVLVVAPAFLCWQTERFAAWGPWRALELACLGIAGIAVMGILFSGSVPLDVVRSLPYLVLPFMAWLAFRFGLREVCIATVIVAGIALWRTNQGQGPFAPDAIHASLLPLQMFVFAVAITALALSAAVVRDRRLGDELRQTNLMLEERVSERTAEIAHTNKKLRSEIEERRGIEHALEVAREHADRIVSGSPAIICGVDGNGRVVFANRAAQQATGRAQDDLIGRDWFAFFFPGEQHVPFSEFIQVFSQDEVHGYEIPLIDSAGNARMISWHATALKDPESGSNEMVVFGNEVTETRRAKEALENAHTELNQLFNAAVPLCVVDADGCFLRVNDAFCVMFRTNREQVLDRMCRTLWPGAVCDTADCVIRQLLRGSPQGEREIELTLPEGEHRSYLVNAVPFQGPQDAIMGAIMSFTDISQRRALETERERMLALLTESNRSLEHLNRRLEESNRELENFAFVASHDLQEPLRKITTFAERLRKAAGGNLDDRSQDYLARMENAAERMRKLIQDLLAYSRITSRAEPFERVELHHVACEVLSDLEARVQATQAHIELDPLPSVEADASQMRQLFQNLIGNSLKYRRADGPCCIHVRSAPPDEEAETVTVSIEDNGIGFNNEQAERIFGMFQRLHGRGEYEGTGIGLAICRKIVQRHGGSITASGRPGEGATFTVRLPRHHAQSSEEGGSRG